MGNDMEQEGSVLKKMEMETLERLADSTETSDSVLAGMMLAQGWKQGKYVSREEFMQAREKFLEGRADGKDILCGQK